MGASAAWRVRLVVHPLTVASVLLLAANDAWFKTWWPGLLTGKLSDVAGVWMVGALAIAATRSVRWGAALTALGFALLKTVSSVAVLAAPVLGGVTRRDPTDLVALLVLWPLGRLAQRLGAQRPAHVNDAWSTIAAAFVMAGASMATTATSCDTQPEVTEVALSSDGVPVANYRSYTSSADDGWYELTDDGPQYRPDASVGGVIAGQACVSDGCYRVERGVGVFFADELVYEYTDAQQANLGPKSSCIQAATFGSIVAVESTDGVDVWVSMGIAGVLHRDPAGQWEEVAIRSAVPPATEAAEPAAAEPRYTFALWLPLLVAAAALGLALPLACSSRWRRGRLALITVAAVGVNLGWAAASYWWLPGLEQDHFPLTVRSFVAFWVAPVIILQLAWLVPLVAWSPSRRPSPPVSWAPPSEPSPFG